MWTRVKTNSKIYNYGIGWEINNIDGQIVIEESGHWQGFSSFMARYPKENLIVIMLSNLGDVDLRPIVHHIADLYDISLAIQPTEKNTSRMLKLQ